MAINNNCLRFNIYYFFLDILASFISSSDDNMKTYNELIMVLLVIPDYAVSHALSALLIKYVKHRETQYHFNFGMSSTSLSASIFT